MGLVLIAVVLVGTWISVEIFSKDTRVRVCAGLTFATICVIVAWVSSSTLGRFESTLETNNVAKNLTRGLVQILETEHSDTILLQNLRKMNDAITPSYEDHGSARSAVEQFLNEYDIKYEREIQIEVNSQTSEIDLVNAPPDAPE